ncbi:MAG: hypothetical protein U0992_04885 [Planctomycetaceae bacterium]
MLALRRLRKPAIWIAASILLLFFVYTGAYYRLVSRAYAAEVTVDATSGTMQIRRVALPVYTLPWPLASQFDHPWLRQKFHTVFKPMNRLDRHLRPGMWKTDERIVNGAGETVRR